MMTVIMRGKDNKVCTAASRELQLTLLTHMDTQMNWIF